MKKAKYILLCLVLSSGSLYPSDHADRKVVRQEQPEYPALAAKLNLHGAVKLRIWITAEGSVRRLEYVGGHPVLAESALKAVKNWKYAPDSQGSTTTVVEIKF